MTHLLESNGLIRGNPLAEIAKKNLMKMVRIAAEFGMTPSARSRVHVILEMKTIPPRSILSAVNS